MTVRSRGRLTTRETSTRGHDGSAAEKGRGGEGGRVASYIYAHTRLLPSFSCTCDPSVVYTFNTHATASVHSRSKLPPSFWSLSDSFCWSGSIWIRDAHRRPFTDLEQTPPLFSTLPSFSLLISPPLPPIPLLSQFPSPPPPLHLEVAGLHSSMPVERGRRLSHLHIGRYKIQITATEITGPRHYWRRHLSCTIT